MKISDYIEEGYQLKTLVSPEKEKPTLFAWQKEFLEYLEKNPRRNCSLRVCRWGRSSTTIGMYIYWASKIRENSDILFLSGVIRGVYSMFNVLLENFGDMVSSYRKNQTIKLKNGNVIRFSVYVDNSSVTHYNFDKITEIVNCGCSIINNDRIIRPISSGRIRLISYGTTPYFISESIEYKTFVYSYDKVPEVYDEETINNFKKSTNYDLSVFNRELDI